MKKYLNMLLVLMLALVLAGFTWEGELEASCLALSPGM